MRPTRSPEDVLRDLAVVAERCDSHHDQLKASRDARDALVLEAIMAGFSERVIASTAGLSGPRIHQIKQQLTYSVQVLDAGLRPYSGREVSPTRERVWSFHAISPDDAVQQAHERWNEEFGEPIPDDAIILFGNTDQPR
jgi:hypothetical protein